MLRIQNLRKAFNGKQVLSDVSFEVQPGSIFALIGPNGAGKTTTFRCITNAISPDGGTIEIFGDIKIENQKEKIAVVTEGREVFKNFTPEDYRKLYSALYPTWSEEMFSRFVAKYNINLKQKVETFSIGMKTLFLVGISICTNADILLLDEPSQHLDPTTRLEMINIIKEYSRLGKIIVISSHEIFEMEEYITDFGVIKNGQVVYSSSLDDAKENHRVISKGESVNFGDEVIGVVSENILVRTTEDIGTPARLNEIVVGYINGKRDDVRIF